MPDPAVRCRFAPSPTGYLHLGGARTALFNWLTARHHGGQMLLRIEDTDADRSQPELVDLIFRTLTWLGIDWDGEVVHQSSRGEAHRAAVGRLLDEGRAYWCSCTRDEIDARAKERGGKPGYDGHCRDRGLGPDPTHVVRFRVPDDGETVVRDLIRGDVHFANHELEDFVVQRSNGHPMFVMANAVDDIDMAITHVIRGEDLLPATPKINLIRAGLGEATTPVFAHLPLIVNEKRQKLSKRRDDVAVEDYQARGFLPEAMRNYLATLGWGPPDGVEIRPIEEIVALFRLEDVTKSSAFFDVKKLEAFNGEYIRALGLGDFVERSLPFLTTAFAPGPGMVLDEDTFVAIAPHVQERVRVLGEIPEMVEFLFREISVDGDAWAKTMEKDPALAVQMLDAAIDLLAALPDWTATAINDAVIGYADAREISRKKAQAPVRVAITGRTVGPPLWESMEVLGRDRSLERLREARAQLPA